MPLLFFIDKDILEDPSCQNIEDIVLSYTFFRYVFIHPVTSSYTEERQRARRNERGHLEPDAPDNIVQDSLGFGNYEHAPKNGGKTINQSVPVEII
jgi:cytochrome c oxidase assembly protein subunit 11